MSMKVNISSEQNFNMGNERPISLKQFPDSGDERQQTSGIHFGTSQGAVSLQGSVNFGGHSPHENNQPDNPNNSSSSSSDNEPGSGLLNQLEKVLQALLQFLKQKDDSHDASSQGIDGSTNGSNSSTTEPTLAAADPASPPPAASAATPQPPPAALPAPAPAAGNPQAIAGTQAMPGTATTDNALSAGSGPFALNITNTQDHAIKIGQFDKNDKLVGELSLEPGQKGTMNYEKDTTGLLKQADADGTYKPDASRLEFYNGFVNTSDIDGRNAAIHATDRKGFEVGDTQSVADKAPANIVSADSAGNKTIAGYYDASTDKMKKGGAFMTETLGTGMTYMHPDDDTLGKGKNPMRHTDSMSLDVTFGKA